SGHLYPKQGIAIINVLDGDILRLSGLGYIDRLYFEVSEDNTTVFAYEGSLYSYQDEAGRYTLLQAYVPVDEYTLELIEGTTGVIEGAYQDTFVQLVIPSTVTDFSTVIGYLPTLKEIVDHTNADAASYVANYCSESMFHVITDAKDSTLRDINGYMLMGVGDDVVFITDVEKRVDVVLPDEVTLLPSRAFVDSHMRSLYIGANVEKVEYLAVFRCEDLLSVTFAGTPEYSPFVECPKLSLLYGDVGYFSSNYIWSSNRRNFFFEPVDSTLRIEEKDGSWYLERESRTYLLDYEGTSYDYVIPSFVSDIGDYAFMGESFHSVTFSENILSMGIKCFEGATVDQVLWPGTISCSSWSFADCDGLEEAYMPQATLIPANAFAWCSKLSKVTFASIVYIRDSAFLGCTSLTNLDFGTQLKVIEGYAFQGTGLEQVYLPDSLESLGSYAFAFCTDLASIRIPSSVLEFNETVLSGNLALKNIILPADHPALSFDDGVLYNRDKTALLVYLSSKEDAEYIMPSSVTSISYAAIRGNPYLKTLQFSDNIEVLEGDEVSSCPSLSKVYLPENLRRFGEKNQSPAFEGCDSLQYYRYEDGNYLGSRSNPIMALIKNVNMNAEEFTVPEGCRFIAQRGFDYSGYGGLT
ncbi:MAG: leucine-rich repeat protein, partial [Bacilli bacterium]|nr:leucine-rich repeat protein [Bacilli bacterium]